MTHRPRVVVGHPAPDTYGSDLQLLVTVDVLRAAGWDVTVVVPRQGPLVPLLREHGAVVEVVSFPVLRRSVATPRGVLGLAGSGAVAAIRLARLIRARRAHVVLANTITVPVWLLAAKLARVPAVCHVHEAEKEHSPILRRVLASPLLLARAVIANSAETSNLMLDAVPRLRGRTTVVHNGVPGPDTVVARRARRPQDPAQLVVVGRLSERKATHVALEAVATLRREGRDVSLVVCGTAVSGSEDYEARLRERAARPDLSGHVELLGYVNPTWPVLADSDVVLVPSLGESLGNVAIEGQLAERPVIVSAVQGLLEVVDDGRTGLTVPPDDAHALAQSIARVLDDAELAQTVAEEGGREARRRFSPAQYGAAMVDVLTRATGRRPPARTSSVGVRDH